MDLQAEERSRVRVRVPVGHSDAAGSPPSTQSSYVITDISRRALLLTGRH